MIDTQFFSEECIDDVVALVHKCGLSTSSEYLRTHLLLNPSLSVSDRFPAGIVIYEEDKCIAFQGLVFRRLFFKEKAVWGCEGSVLAIDKAYSYAVGELIENIMKPYGESIYYGNTCIPQTVRLLKVAGMRSLGPRSCEVISFFVLRWGDFLRVLLKKQGVEMPSLVRATANIVGYVLNAGFYQRLRSKTKAEKRTHFDAEDFDQFWRDYLHGSDGVATSRTSAELKWLFEEGLLSGRFVLLVRKIEEHIVGYVVLKQHRAETGFRWMVADWIALNNDSDVLHDLLLDARRFAAITGAFCLEITGFPMRIQPTVRSCFPFVRKALGNTFAYKLFDDLLREALLETPDKGWFWGPMDGDRCVN